jgi:MFS family permease
MWLLISITFFEGYDEAVLSLAAPQVQDTYRVDDATLGIAHGAIDSGSFFAFFLTRLADRYGRRRLLSGPSPATRWQRPPPPSAPTWPLSSCCSS